MACDAQHIHIDRAGPAGAVAPMGRRRALSLIAGLGAVTVAACSGRGDGTASAGAPGGSGGSGGADDGDAIGEYSLYSQSIADENYLRGVQEADADGRLRFTTVFPGAYSGRWPHIHFEVFASLDDATGGGTPVTTSQIALPADTCEAVYASDGYEQSVRNVARTSLASDTVFGDDGGVDQLATVTGSVRDGLVASLTVPV